MTNIDVCGMIIEKVQENIPMTSQSERWEK